MCSFIWFCPLYQIYGIWWVTISPVIRETVDGLPCQMFQVPHSSYIFQACFTFFWSHVLPSFFNYSGTHVSSYPLNSEDVSLTVPLGSSCQHDFTATYSSISQSTLSDVLTRTTSSLNVPFKWPWCVWSSSRECLAPARCTGCRPSDCGGQCRRSAYGWRAGWHQADSYGAVTRRDGHDHGGTPNEERLTDLR